MQSIPRNTRFLSTPSARRATGRPAGRLPHPQISIHALREEGDPTVPPLAIDDGQFLSTPSARRATPSGAGRKPSKNISIHALREEGDIDELREIAVEEDFYPRPPRGGRLVYHFQHPRLVLISIHALREEGDPHTRHDTHTRTLFLSTPSARRATALIYPQGGFGPFLSTPSARRATAGRHGSSATVAISIHALREEGDPPSSKSGRPSANFYPRPPRGGRLFCAARAASSRVFLSTPSARRATRAGEPFLLLPEISIHALREEGDRA